MQSQITYSCPRAPPPDTGSDPRTPRLQRPSPLPPAVAAQHPACAEMRAGKPRAPGMSMDTRYRARERLPPQQGCSPRRRPRRSPPQHSPVDSSCPSARSPAARTTGNQRRRGMTATTSGTTWRHRRGAPPSSHEPGQPPPRPHVAPPRPAPPAPRPRPRSAPGAKEARHEWTSTQGRTQFVACGRDSPAPEPCCERLLPALKGRDPGAADRGPLRAASPSSAPPSAHPLRAFRKTSAAKGKARVQVGSY